MVSSPQKLSIPNYKKSTQTFLFKKTKSPQFSSVYIFCFENYFAFVQGAVINFRDL